MVHLVAKFYERVSIEYSQKISKSILETIYSKYWKNEREKRKNRSFLRIFWEKADFDDSDPISAFRKRHKDKMKLRKKTKYELESYSKMHDLRIESVRVLKLL